MEVELSLLAVFDDIRRCRDVLTDGTAEIGMVILLLIDFENT